MCQYHCVVVAGFMKLCQCNYVVVAGLIVGLVTAACIVVLTAVLVVILYKRYIAVI